MSRGIHATAQAGWSGRGADDYERGRPGYPRAAVRLIGAELGVAPGTRILDLAAGTGKLTRELGILGAEVIAVEPVAAMREKLLAAAPGVRVLDGTAEAIPLPDGAVRAVTVAQAFHWFEVERAAAEIARVLDAGGGLAIVRNEWAQEAPWSLELRRFIHERVARPGTHTRDWKRELDATGRFEPFAERSLANPWREDLQSLRYHVASMSFVAALPAAEREPLLDDAEALLRGHGMKAGQPLSVPARTVVRWARHRASP